MITLLPLDQMSRGEKLRALMDLENDLFPVTNDKPPPSWHLELLEETERRLAAGAPAAGADPLAPYAAAAKSVLVAAQQVARAHWSISESESRLWEPALPSLLHIVERLHS